MGMTLWRFVILLLLVSFPWVGGISLAADFPLQVAKAEAGSGNGKPATYYLKRGVAFLQKGRYDQAVAEFNKVLAINPRASEAYYYRGNAHCLQDQHDRAIQDYNRALEINPKLAGAYLNRGSAYVLKAEYDQAICDYNQALQLNAQDPMAYSNRAVAYYYRQQYDQAWEDVHKAASLGLQVNPQFLQGLREASENRERMLAENLPLPVHTWIKENCKVNIPRARR
jgi:tetratricopeptide (TPR) repeat protein